MERRTFRQLWLQRGNFFSPTPPTDTWLIAWEPLTCRKFWTRYCYQLRTAAHYAKRMSRLLIRALLGWKNTEKHKTSEHCFGAMGLFEDWLTLPSLTHKKHFDARSCEVCFVWIMLIIELTHQVQNTALSSQWCWYKISSRLMAFVWIYTIGMNARCY